MHNEQHLPSIEALAREMRDKREAMEVVIGPETVFALVAMLQLAARHPSMDFQPDTAERARRFIQAARQYFADCPGVVTVIDAGDDPHFDGMEPPSNPADLNP